MAAPDAAILQEIARISGVYERDCICVRRLTCCAYRPGAINRAKAANQDSSSSTTTTAGPSASSRGRHAYDQAPSYSQRGAHSHAQSYRGRGYPSAYALNGGPFRGSHSSHHYSSSSGRGGRQHNITRVNNTWTAASVSPSTSTSSDAVGSSRHKKLVLNNPVKGKSVSPATIESALPTLPSETQSVATPDTPVASHDLTTPAEAAQTSASTEEPNKTTPTTLEEDVDMEEGEIDESKLPPPEPKKPPISLIKQGNEIIINGVTFVSDPSGRKLVRKDSTSTTTSGKSDVKGKGKMVDGGSNTDTSTTSTPSKTSIDGQAYVRTKSGNLISTAVLKKRQEMAEKKKSINALVTVAKNVQKARQA